MNFILTPAQKGEIYNFFGALLWSLFPIVTLFSYHAVAPLFAGALSTLFAALFFAILLTVRKEWHELTVKKSWKDIMVATVLIGIVYYALMFIGIQKTTAGNAGIISLMEVFFSLFLLRLFKKEFLKKSHIAGAVLMSLGAFMVLFQEGIEVNKGNLLILIAAAAPPLGNYFAQEARKKVGSNAIMFLRSLISGLFLLLLAYGLELPPSAQELALSIPFIFANGFLLLGLSKILWIEAIHRIPITKAIALNSVTALLTLFFAYFTLKEIPTLWQIVGVAPMLIGIFLLTDFRNWSAARS